MSVFHTPRCSILWTEVRQGGQPTNVVDYNGDLELRFGLSLDPAIWNTSGYFVQKFVILQDDQLVAIHPWSGWIPHHPGRPRSQLWVSLWWYRAPYATKGRTSVFLFQPSVDFMMWGPGGVAIPSEFAVAEEDHYFVV